MHALQVELMVGKNQALLAEKAELKRKAELADQTEQELIKRSQVFQKTIKNLVRLSLDCLECDPSAFRWPALQDQHA